MNIKVWGILGAGFLSLAFIPSVSVLFTILGLIFTGIALNALSKNEKVFNYFLIASLLSFIATMLFYFKLIAVITSFVLGLFSNNPVVPIGFSILIYFTIYYVLQIVSAVYFKKSFYLLGEEYNNRYLKIAGNFLIAGAVLNIFAIGLIVSVIGWLLILIGFVTIEEIINAEIIEEEKFLENKN
ncbi:conserved hypothetical protein [Nautilia profundicola AmH]|uniref:DUF996 domain-containing protein n=1 Tax=Nautilia profundicola (strain ATCC BAA-1463 / DSM 18972 / AmH) TaxID=598659 RepID=B9L9P5_NAUPA|nr:DUF996 domain-containing protein [Nautilia profundicola]ACM92899.1 conserved hypothetical protein [Nautilia profundicola AmH]